MNEAEWMGQVRQLIREKRTLKAQHLIAKGLQQFRDFSGYATVLLLKGELAESQLKMREAARHFEAAIEVLRPLAAVVPDRLVRALLGLGASLHQLGRYTEAIPYFDEGTALCEAENLPDDLCRCLRSAGFNHHVLGHYKLSQQLTERSLQLAIEHRLPAREGEALRNLAGIHWDAGRDDVSLDYNLKSLKLAWQLGDEQGAGFTLNNMALLYLSRHDPARAEECLNDADRLLGHLPDVKLNTCYNRAKVYYYSERYTKALATARKAAQLAQQQQNEMRYAFSLEYISKALHKLNKNSEALLPQQQALAVFVKAKRRDSTVTSYQHLGRIYTALKKFNEARQALNTARQMAAKDQLNPYLLETHELLSQLEEAAGNPREALEHFKKVYAFRLKVFTHESESEINRLKVQFETEKAERELALLRQEKESSLRTFAIARKQYKLSPREHEILKLLVAGHSYKMIAAQLGISYETTREHIAHLYKKMGVGTNTEAVGKAVKEGLV